MSDLRERVARVLADGQGEHAEGVWKFYLKDADAAIALVLEEAAKVAEYRCGSPEWSAETNSGYECAAKEIAATFRAEIERLEAALREIAKHPRGGCIDTPEKMDRDDFIGIASAALAPPAQQEEDND